MGDSGARHLGIYLNDHLAGSMTAIELVRRAVEQYKDTELGDFFARIGAEIEQDRDTLKEVMAANGVAIRRYKLAAAWAAEKAARLKFNGALLRRSPLTPMVELETLVIGIHGKEQLLRVLRANAPDEAAAARFDELIERARKQHDDVEQHRIDAGKRALSPARAA
jgi:hypothetical protein